MAFVPHRPSSCKPASHTITHSSLSAAPVAPYPSPQNDLRLGHAYTVLRTAAVGGGSDGMLVRLRGPLPAREGWRGEWADDSPRWTPEVLSSLRAAEAAADQSGRRDVSGAVRRLEDEGGQAFWVSAREASSSFVEVGVCFASPTPAPAPGNFFKPVPRRDGSGGWAQVARRRVVFLRRCLRGAGAASPVETKVFAVGQRGRWVPSHVYALSVYAVSRMFFSLYQVCVGTLGDVVAICLPQESAPPGSFS